jgi:hypothetical protein
MLVLHQKWESRVRKKGVAFLLFFCVPQFFLLAFTSCNHATLDIALTIFRPCIISNYLSFNVNCSLFLVGYLTLMESVPFLFS